MTEEYRQQSGQRRDISSKEVLGNPVLCAQFIRDNVNIPCLRNVQPEDIEDVSERYRPYLGTEFESDTVKRIRIRKEQSTGLSLHFLSRISQGEAFRKWIPDFTYEAVRLHDYSNEELMGRGNEMSLIMLFNKIQDVVDISRFLELPKEKLDEMVKDTPDAILDIIVSVMESLIQSVVHVCRRMNTSREQAARELMKECAIDEETARQKAELYWEG